MTTKTHTLRKGRHFLRFTSSDSKPGVHIFENWDGNIHNIQEEGIYSRTVKRESARKVWRQYQSKGYQLAV